jgi:radical SAM superfamily enzyme YgiQ (UPF0313 family)
VSIRISINSVGSVLEHFGKRALLAPQVLASFLLARDPDVEIILDDFDDRQPSEEIASRILSRGADLIGFSTYVWNIEKVLNVCTLLGRDKRSTVVLGGPGATYTARDILSTNPTVDFVILGEGEEALGQLVQRMKTGRPDLASIPNLAYLKNGTFCETDQVTENLANHTYHLDSSSWQDCRRICYETSRGCVMKCKFCLWYKGDSTRIRCYSLKKVKSDLQSIFDLPELRVLELVDADINTRRGRALEIFQHIRALNDARVARGWNRVFVLFETNPEMMNDTLIEEYAQHDRIVDFGLQTINEELNRSIVGRPFNKDRYFGALRKLAEVPSDKYSEYMLEIIYGLPSDTLLGFEQTIEYILSLPYSIRFWSFRFLMLPGTRFCDEAERFGLVASNRPPYEIICSDTWSEEDLEEAKYLSFHFCLVQYGLPEVFEMAKAMIQNRRLEAFRELFKEYHRFPEVRALFGACAGPGLEVYRFQRCIAVSSDPVWHSLRQTLQGVSYEILGRLSSQ